jgi:hypothetical protein
VPRPDSSTRQAQHESPRPPLLQHPGLCFETHYGNSAEDKRTSMTPDATVVEAVGEMIRRQSKPLPSDREARTAFDDYVRAIASGRNGVQLSEPQLQVLRLCDRRASDILPNDTRTPLGFAEGKTYRDAINLCERINERVGEEKVQMLPDRGGRQKTPDRRRTDRRGSTRFREVLRALRNKFSH